MQGQLPPTSRAVFAWANSGRLDFWARILTRRTPSVPKWHYFSADKGVFKSLILCSRSILFCRHVSKGEVRDTPLPFWQNQPRRHLSSSASRRNMDKTVRTINDVFYAVVERPLDQ